jgi:UDP-glucuronate 4-epimerase
MKILVTGSAGFIGSALSIKLLDLGNFVVGIDNHNDYYDVSLKESRLARHLNHINYKHIRMDISDSIAISELFKTNNFDVVVNLAAQAGVRYSLENPMSYINSNILGFANILEGCRNNKIKHLVYASSSSVYGSNTKVPFSIHDNVDHPISLYAASKKANELMAHSYSHLYNLPTTGLRFFTVYGPWDRPDMALQKFSNAMMLGQRIKVYNYGNHLRDFTYIDDIIEALVRVVPKPATSNIHWSGDKPDPSSSLSPWRIYNIGNSNPVKLNDYINALESELQVKANKEYLPIQPGDVPNTYADVKELIDDFNYKPKISIEKGVGNFARWFKSYYDFH